MTGEQVNNLMANEWAPHTTELVETHISWVILGPDKVYKIKKPVHYSFLNFSTLAARNYYCQREVELNQRFSFNIYLGVIPIIETLEGCFFEGKRKGTVIDHAVVMNKLDGQKQMDKMLVSNQVNKEDMERLAEKIGVFHQYAKIIWQKDRIDICEEYNDLQNQSEFVTSLGQDSFKSIIDEAIQFSNNYSKRNQPLLQSRLQKGFIRDVHGDLHTRNIFLLPEPTPFDCIEFNDDFRQIDVLNDVAFLCMDLDAFGRADLSSHFFKKYNEAFRAVETPAEYDLFVYYKSYRASIRAKVNCLRAAGNNTPAQKNTAIKQAEKYLHLMQCYVRQLASA